MFYSDVDSPSSRLVHTRSGRALRVAPRTDLRTRAAVFAPDVRVPWQAMLEAYQAMPEEDMFKVVPVDLRTPLATLLSRPRVRTACAFCGEDIINEREVAAGGMALCRSCAHGGYYTAAPEGTDHVRVISF